MVPSGRSPRTDILLKAEKAVLQVGGCVVRLVGLYKSDRGAHMHWLKKGTVDAHPDHILNLIHYKDAASLSVAILKKQLRGRTFLGCDNHPLSRLYTGVLLFSPLANELPSFVGKIATCNQRMRKQNEAILYIDIEIQHKPSCFNIPFRN